MVVDKQEYKDEQGTGGEWMKGMGNLEVKIKLLTGKI